VPLYVIQNPNSFFEKLVYSSGPAWFRELLTVAFKPSTLMKMALSKVGFAVKVDLDGNVLQSFQDPEGKKISAVTEVDEAPNGDLYFGGLKNDFLGYVKKEFVKG